MNWLLICSKADKKTLEPLVQKPETLLGTLTEIPNSKLENAYKEILDNYSPHGVIISGSSCGFSFETAVNFRKLNKKLTIIFITEISLEKTEMIEQLFSNSIFVTEKLNLLEIPRPSEILDKLREMREKEEEKKELENLSNQEANENSETITKIDLALNAQTVEENLEDLANENFSKDIISVFNEVQAQERNNGAVFIGLTELLHHLGCTHTSFEIASFLHQQNKKVCIVISDQETYGSLADYHGIKLGREKNGFEVSKITVLPFNLLTLALSKYDFVVGDFGFLRPTQKADFIKANIKIMLCSAADWDLRVIMSYLNSSSDSYKKEIFYLFYPISKSRFLRFNKQFIKGGCRAFRLETSLGFTEPCKENRDVYAKILNFKNNKNNSKKKGIFGII